MPPASSASALYHLEVYLAAGAITGLVPGIYRYLPVEGALKNVAEGIQRAAPAAAKEDAPSATAQRG